MQKIRVSAEHHRVEGLGGLPAWLATGSTLAPRGRKPVTVRISSGTYTAGPSHALTFNVYRIACWSTSRCVRR